MIILTACDRPYLHHAKALIGSIAANTPHVVNFTLIQDQGRGPDWQKDFCANWRTAAMMNAIYAVGPALWLDADSLVRAPLDALEFMLKTEADVIAVETPEMAAGGYEPNEWLISTVGISNSDGGRYFVSLWLDIQKRLMSDPAYAPSIMTCQEAFVKAIKESRKQTRHHVRIKDIGYKWSDKHMRDHTPIWEAQGPRKGDPKWIAEQAKYL